MRAVAAYYAVLDLRQPPPGVDDDLDSASRNTFSAMNDDARPKEIIRHTLEFLRGRLEG